MDICQACLKPVTKLVTRLRLGVTNILLMTVWMFSPSKSPLTVIGCIVSISRVTHHVAMP